MPVGGVVIQFKADADKARKDIDKLTKTLGGVDNTARSASSGISKLAKAGVAALAVGAAMGAAALYDFAKAAAADWQEAEKLKRTLGAVPGITDAMVAANARWIDSMEIATGFSDTEFRNSISRLAVATGSLTEAQTLAALAADVAAARNISLATASGLLEKAAAGNTMQLKRQMPWLDANKDGTITMAEAVKGLTDAYGGAAAAAADNNPWVRIQAVWNQMKEALGAFILPFLERMGNWFADKKNQGALQGWIEKVGEWSRSIGENLAGKLGEFIGWLQSPEASSAWATFTGYVGGLAESLGGLQTSLGGFRDFWASLNDELFGPGSLGENLKQMWDLIVKVTNGAYKLTHGGKTADQVEKENYAKDAPKRAAALQRAAPYLGPTGAYATSGGTTNVYVKNGVQEKIEDTAALAIRIARRTGGR